MRALVLDERVRLATDHPRPSRPAGAARIRVRLAGICDTDIQLSRGYMGFRGVLGHEYVGEVTECDEPEWLGRRVVADINAGCGRCAECLQRDGHHCPTRTVVGILGRDGALAEEVVVPERCLRAVPDAIRDDHAVFAEPLAAAAHVLDALSVGPERVVVIGDGKLGLLTARALILGGHQVSVVGHHEQKLQIARLFGAEAQLESAVDTRALLADASVDATGSARGIALAIALTRPRGTVVLKTTVAGPTPVDLSPVVVNELTVVGSRCGDMSRALELLHQVDPTPLITARYPLDQAEQAFQHACTRGALKVLVEPGSA